MGRFNPALTTPTQGAKYWTGAVAGNQSLLNYKGLCARMVVVCTVPVGSALVITDDLGSKTYTDTDIIAHNYVLRGQFTGLTAAGSGCYDIWAYW